MTHEIKMAEAVRMSAWQPHFSSVCELNQEVLKSLRHFNISNCGSHIYNHLFTTKKTLWERERSMIRKRCSFWAWRCFTDMRKLLESLLFLLPRSLPPSFPPAGPDCKSPCNYPHHWSLEGSPSTTGHIRGAKCLSPPREKYSFVWRGSLLIQRLCSPVIVPRSEGREIFTFPVTDCCGKHCNIRV